VSGTSGNSGRLAIALAPTYRGSPFVTEDPPQRGTACRCSRPPTRSRSTAQGFQPRLPQTRLAGSCAIVQTSVVSVKIKHIRKLRITRLICRPRSSLRRLATVVPDLIPQQVDCITISLNVGLRSADSTCSSALQVLPANSQCLRERDEIARPGKRKERCNVCRVGLVAFTGRRDSRCGSSENKRKLVAFTARATGPRHFNQHRNH